MKLLGLAWQSLLARKILLSFSALAMAASLALVLSLQSLKSAAEEGFTQTISQVDLLVGARGGSLQLLLFSVFNIGSATNNVSMKTYEKWQKHPSIQWTIPYSLGDSFRGFRVVGTTQDFFDHYRFRGDQSLKVKIGAPFKNEHEAVLGADVARELKLKMGDSLVISHGVTKGAGVIHHDDEPFSVVGILEQTGTALDQSVYISLAGMEHIHHDPQSDHDHDHDHEQNLESSITSFFVRTKNRVETLQLQREINEDKGEPLMAIIPGVALSELWHNLSFFERALQLMVWMVGIFGILIVVLLLNATLETRRRELSLLRSLGASLSILVRLILIESLMLSFLGSILGVALHRILLLVVGPTLQSEFGMNFQLGVITKAELFYMAILIVVCSIVSLVPAWAAQRRVLKDGLIPKL